MGCWEQLLFRGGVLFVEGLIMGTFLFFHTIQEASKAYTFVQLQQS